MLVLAVIILIFIDLTLLLDFTRLHLLFLLIIRLLLLVHPFPLHCLHVHHLIEHLTDLLLLAPIQARRPLLPVVLDVRGEPVEYEDHQSLEEGDAAVELSVIEG